MLLAHNTSLIFLDHKLLLLFLINFFTIAYAYLVCAICVL